MKKVFFVLAAAACMVACGNKAAENTEAVVEDTVVVEEVAEVDSVVAEVVEAVEAIAEEVAE